MSKIDVDAENKNVSIGYDHNEDGEPSAKLSLNVGEAIQEAIQKGTALEGVQAVSVSFEYPKVYISVDTDRDGEKSIVFEADIAEAIDESGVLK